MKLPEPFGYFKAEPFGWADCGETDEGAQPLWDEAAIREIEKQRDDLLAALENIFNSSEARIGYDEYQAACEAITIAKGGAA